MRIPESLASLVDYGLIDDVLRPLMAGKEAQIYLVRSCGEERVAKVYKEAQQRSFRQRAAYTEGRKVRNSRDQRAMSKRSRYGRSQDEAAWRATEVDTIYRLQTAGVRVPVPHHFVDGVLVMELIKDADGQPAPRLGDLRDLSRDQAHAIFDQLLAQVLRMLCAGVVHGDLSDFNVLMAEDGPVVIDFPQAVDASSNQNARKILLRDVDNLHRFLERCVGPQRRPPFAQEMWDLYERGQLTPDVKLTGRHRASERKADVKDVLSHIGDAERDERRRREGRGLSMRQSGSTEPASEPTEVSPPPPRTRRVMVEVRPPGPEKKGPAQARRGPRRGERTEESRGAGQHAPGTPGRRRQGVARAEEGQPAGPPAPESRRRRRNRGSAAEGRQNAARPTSERSGTTPDRERSAPHAPRPTPRPQGEGPAAANRDDGGAEGAPRKRRRRRRRSRTESSE